VDDDDLFQLSLKDFVREYIDPAAKELARKVKAHEPLSELEIKILQSCGFEIPKQT
jgi:hypothetical protein